MPKPSLTISGQWRRHLLPAFALALVSATGNAALAQAPQPNLKPQLVNDVFAARWPSNTPAQDVIA
ncbi:MAG: hypothetical protein WCO67_22100, partial [Betaproteobacteria bacterium]